MKDGTALSVRPAKRGDEPALLAFYRDLPPEDRLFLKEDVTTESWAERPMRRIEVSQALPTVVEHAGPIYFRMVRGDIGGPCPRVSPEGYLFRLGRATLLREGKDSTLIGSGLMLSRCVQAAEILAGEGISADVINVSTIKPLDTALILERAQRTRAVVTAENHTILGGLGGAVAELLGEACPVPVRRVGVRDQFGESAPLEDLLPHFGLTAEAVMDAAQAALAAKARP